MNAKLIWSGAIVVFLFSARNAPCRAEGNVSAFVRPDRWGENTLLTIEGDHRSNDIRIIQDACNHVWVEGLNGTSVNGKSADELSSSQDVFRLASVDLGNGDDFVEYVFNVFTGAQYTQRSHISTGNGNDQVSVLVSGIVGFLTIDTGTGSDSATLQLASDSVISDVEINTGTGNDAVFFEADNSRGVPDLIGWTLIDTEQGNDEVHFDGYVDPIFGDTYVRLGEGDDVLVGDSGSQVLMRGDVEALGGAGSDIVLNAAYFRALYELQQFEAIVE